MLAALLMLAGALAPQTEQAEQHYRQGLEHFRRREMEAARQAFARAVELAPARAPYWKVLGVVYAAQERYREAEAPFRKACELDPAEEDACYYLGRNYYSMNRFEPALLAYQKALGARGRLWRVHNGMALCHEALGHAEDAERHFRKAVELNKGQARPDEDPRIDLGAFLFRQGRAEEALAPLASVGKELPASSRGCFELGRALFQLDRLAEAAAQLEKAVQLNPGYREAHVVLGKVYFRLGRAADAERHMKLGEGAEAQGSRIVR